MSARAGDASVAAIDLGASSGRVVVAEIGPDYFATRIVARFANRPVTLAGHLQWDLPSLWANIADGLTTAVRTTDRLVAVGVDSWGVDYGLLRHGRLLAGPMHYRDLRTASTVERVHERVTHPEQYQRAGTQFMPINTIYQLASDQDFLALSDTVLLMPDLVTWLLSNVRITERTIASTTGLLGLDGRWDPVLLAAAPVAETAFAPFVEPGTMLGPLRADVARQIGATERIEVVAVAAHDTASALVATPLTSSSAAFISCGTWGLVGVESSSPIASEDARLAGFTNERGVDGTFLFMRNAMGMWLLNGLVRQWEREGYALSIAELMVCAGSVSRDLPLFDVDDPLFAVEGDTASLIVDWYRERGADAPRDRAEIARSVVESLAQAYSVTLADLARLTGTPIDVIHIVGGGSNNALLCQSIANRSGLAVFAGPDEASAMGNLLIQARTVGLISGTVADLRQLVWRIHPPTRYSPL